VVVGGTVVVVVGRTVVVVVGGSVDVVGGRVLVGRVGGPVVVVVVSCGVPADGLLEARCIPRYVKPDPTRSAASTARRTRTWIVRCWGSEGSSGAVGAVGLESSDLATLVVASLESGARSAPSPLLGIDRALTLHYSTMAPGRAMTGFGYVR
jgi:hypothetical protein